MKCDHRSMRLVTVENGKPISPGRLECATCGAVSRPVPRWAAWLADEAERFSCWLTRRRWTR